MIELGSSDAPVIMGVSPYLTPWQLWAQKLGMIEAPPENEAMRWGSFLEASVVSAFAELQGWRVVKRSPETTEHHPDRKWQRATADALLEPAYSFPAIIEVKSVVGHPPSTPRVDWLVQCLHQRMVYEATRMSLPQFLVCYGNLHLEWWEIPRHEKAMAAMLRAEEHFLALLETQTPPPVRAEDAGPLAKFWRETHGGTVLLTSSSDALKWDRQYAQASEYLKTATEMKDEAEAHLKAMIGPAEKAVLANGTTYTWRPQTRKGYTVEPKTIRMFRRIGGNDDA